MRALCEDFMKFFRDDDLGNMLSDADRREVFLGIMPVIDAELLDELVRGYGAEIDVFGRYDGDNPRNQAEQDDPRWQNVGKGRGVKNAGRKDDSDKLAYNLLPMDALDEVVRRFTHGAKKYAPDTWQKVDDAVERYSAALMRHYSAWRQGEQNDPEAPGLTHIGAVAWNALVLVYFDLHKKEKHGYTTGGESHGK